MTYRRWLALGNILSGAVIFVAAMWAMTQSGLTPGSPRRDVQLGEAFDVTAYCLKGRTSDGGRVRPGVLAADPNVLAPGSIVELHFDVLVPMGLMHSPFDGVYVVADTGDDIVGRRLDLWIRSCPVAWVFGHKIASVKILR